MKETKNCHTCQRHYYNLMSANCGHKICFHCVKNNRNTAKCSQCLTQLTSNHRPRTPLLSPSRNVSNEPKQKSTKVKDSDSKLISETSPIHGAPTRKSYYKSTIGWPQQQVQTNALPVIKCKDHQQPLTMYCKSTRDLICSVCVCNRAKLNYDIVPLRMAQDFLKKEVKLQRQESKSFLSSIQSAQKTISKNIQKFQSSYQNGLKQLQQIFTQMKLQIQKTQQKLRQELITSFDNKFKECDQITQDLNYLNNILTQYKDNKNIQNCTFSQLVYMFTSFKVIKNTVKGLNLDYIAYCKDISVVDVNKYHYKDTIKDYVRLKLDLPLKYIPKKRNKSHSNKSISRSKYDQWDDRKTQKPEKQNIVRRHQMSLCCNVHGMQMGAQQKNVYKMLLKNKFKL